MRNIKQIHSAEYEPIADLITYRAFPTHSIGMENLNPFIFLNHHGPQYYTPNNNGLPFGPHPHRGMETVTFILEGDILHKDSGGFISTISEGGIQRMKAGKGLIHAEVSSPEFKKNGGRLEILQLWLNLPSKDKMDEPVYKGYNKEEIPALNKGEDVSIEIISGKYEDTSGAFNSDSNAQLNLIRMKQGGELQLVTHKEYKILFYLIKGDQDVNGTRVKQFHLAEFEDNDDLIKIKSLTDSILLFGEAPALKEPIAAQGPFVMNTDEEIINAYNDYKRGAFGKWIE